MLQQSYGKIVEMRSGPSEVVVFEAETISLQLENGDFSPMEETQERNGWRITPLNKMQVRATGISLMVHHSLTQT